MISMSAAILVLTFALPNGLQVTTKVEGLNFSQCVKMASKYMNDPNEKTLKSVTCQGENGDSIEYQVK